MRVVSSPQTLLRDARSELSGGLLVAPFENPRRVEMILDAVAREAIGPVEAPQDFGLAPILRVHAPDYVDFLATVFEAWRATGAQGEAIPINWPAGGAHPIRRPSSVLGKLGFYALAADSSIGPNTYEAALASAEVALHAMAQILAGERQIFALCRPPGHHAARAKYGGYCFFNNAAIAAQYALDHGAARVAILDVDFHHGNGTQEIFYDRDDVFFVSIHGDPAENFPFFSGYADEIGQGAGEGFSLNFPLPRGADWAAWGGALRLALARIEKFSPDILVVSLGLDAFEGDPISFFRLSTQDFSRLGAAIAGLKRPTLFALEGGYAVADLGRNLCATLAGFEGAP